MKSKYLIGIGILILFIPFSFGLTWNFGGRGGIKDHSKLINLNWSSAGHTIDTDLDMNSHNITKIDGLKIDGNSGFGLFFQNLVNEWMGCYDADSDGKCDTGIFFNTNTGELEFKYLSTSYFKFDIVNGKLTIGSGTNGEDPELIFNGFDNNGKITWMEDENYFKSDDDFIFSNDKKIYFRDTNNYIYSSGTNYLSFTAGGVESFVLDPTQMEIRTNVRTPIGNTDYVNLSWWGDINQSNGNFYINNLSFQGQLTPSLNSNCIRYQVSVDDNNIYVCNSTGKWRKCYLEYDGNSTADTYYAEVYYYNFSVGTEIPINQTFQVMGFENATNGTHLNGFKYWFNGQLQEIVGGGTYYVSYEMRGEGSQNHKYEGAIFVNEVEQQTAKSETVGDANDRVDMTGYGIINLNKYDNVTLRLRDLSGSGTGTYSEGKIILMRVGN